MMKYLKKTAARWGCEFHPPSRAYNTRLAQEITKWASSRSKGNEMHQKLFHAYFVQSLNISDPEILLQIVASTSLPVGDAEDVLKNRTFQLEVDQDWAESKRRHISAVPTLIFNKNRLVGAQSPEVLNDFLQRFYR